MAVPTPLPAVRWWSILIGVAVAVILAVVAWLFFNQAANAQAIREVSQALRIPRAPLYVYFGLSAALSAVMALVTIPLGRLHTGGTEHMEDAL
ncbi:hypothetical protein FQ775_13400 [Nitratireductor mangrovi]|uniref:Uncharacterized protein n=1 Tax=Nitratireductor mangrovi TaxID=2599600 RepID=A0A5B8L0A3_9HYPH|nr:hypothetical protein [Nitratireductor mangrovi]QDZ01296.1 hypothetical protein FQ775_13400 [Nitratireductor mangrovi]